MWASHKTSGALAAFASDVASPDFLSLASLGSGAEISSPVLCALKRTADHAAALNPTGWSSVTWSRVVQGDGY
ncbi:hypothetical protein E2562_032845 [Oryza meyeriana var. granulata]|uniref:Uncharacterized protein n=1 Tax=Oryza meyeriana var. granulata TaxID=110450 RepID=A0A6G1DS55_9ORYZ|nr:hypothetical protein E2562_032845 [Oryza meyeriana var. granulata]